MAERPRLQRARTFQPVALDTGATEVAEGLAQTLGAFSQISAGVAENQIEQNRRKEADELAAAQAKIQQAERESAVLRGREGLIAGQEAVQRDNQTGELIQPELQQGKASLTPYGEAYNKAAMLKYTSEVKQDFQSRLTEIVSESGDNFQDLQSKSQGYISGLLASMPPELAAAVAPDLDKMANTAFINSKNQFLVNERKEQQAVVNAEIERHTEAILSAARAGENVDELITEATNTLTVAGESNLYQSDTVRKIKESWKEGVEEQKFYSTVEKELKADPTINGVISAQNKLNELKDKQIPGLTPNQRDKYIFNAQKIINGQRSQLQADANLKAREAKVALDDYQNAQKFGFKVSPEDTAKVANLVKGDEALEQRFNLLQETAAFAVSSHADRQSELLKLQTGQIENVDQFVAFSVSNNAINEAARKDGYALAVQQGLITPEENVAFDFNDPASFQQKVINAEKATSHYGVPVSPFTDAEATGIANQIQQMTVDEKVSLATTLASAPSVWGQLAGKNQNVFSMAGATGDTPVMQQIFTGQELLKEKLVTRPKPEDYLTTFRTMVEGVYNIDDESSMLEASLAHYAASASDPNVFNSSEFEDSVRAVSGGLGEVNGKKVELPRNVTESEFNDYIDWMTPEVIELSGGVNGVTNERAIELIQGGILVNEKTGVYSVKTINGDLMSASDPTKKFLITWRDEYFSINRARQSIQQSQRTFDVLERVTARGL